MFTSLGHLAVRPRRAVLAVSAALLVVAAVLGTTWLGDTFEAANTFPTVIFANMLKFTKREYFEADEASREVPKIGF